MVILATHELGELSLCTSVYALKEGQLTSIAAGMSAEELIHQFR